MSGLQVVSAPALEPVDLTTIKGFLRVDQDQDDGLIETILIAARASCEGYTGRSFISQSLRYDIDMAPLYTMRETRQTMILPVPRPPLISVEKISINDKEGGVHILEADSYQVNPIRQPGEIRFSSLSSFLSANITSMTIDYHAGYGADAENVPEDIRLAIMQTVAFFYQNRGDAYVRLPIQAISLLAPYKILTLEGRC